MKKILFVSMLIFALQSAFAQATQPVQIGGEMFVQRHNTIAALDVPVKTLWQKGNVSLDWSALIGYNATTTTSAFGTAVAAHYAFNGKFEAIFGLGCTYDTSKTFAFTDVTSNSVGLVVGLLGKF